MIPHPLDCDLRTLSLAQRPLGEGGQGKVLRVTNKQGLVYKEYHPSLLAKVNAAALSRLVDFPGTLPAADRDTLLDFTAWPLGRVVDNGRVTGFLMREIPAAFSTPIGGAKNLVELQYLLYKPNWAWEDLPLPDQSGRAAIALRMARFINMLHEHLLVLGDISSRNLLWRPVPPYEVFLLDCDSFRIHATDPVLPQPHTPDWEDPLQPATGPDLDSDRYKLAMTVGRILARNADVRPGAALPLLPGLEPRVTGPVLALFGRAGSAKGTRPIAREWVQAIGGRQWTDVASTPLVTLSSVPTDAPKAPLDGPPASRSWTPAPTMPSPAQPRPTVQVPLDGSKPQRIWNPVSGGS